MSAEQFINVSRGNITADFDNSEIRIGFIGSLSRKRETMHRALESFAQIFRYVEVTLGSTPESISGYTNRNMAVFLERRFGAEYNLEIIGDAGEMAYKIRAETKRVVDVIASVIDKDKHIIQSI